MRPPPPPAAWFCPFRHDQRGNLLRALANAGGNFPQPARALNRRQRLWAGCARSAASIARRASSAVPSGIRESSASVAGLSNIDPGVAAPNHKLTINIHQIAERVLSLACSCRFSVLTSNLFVKIYPHAALRADGQHNFVKQLMKTRQHHAADEVTYWQQNCPFAENAPQTGNAQLGRGRSALHPAGCLHSSVVRLRDPGGDIYMDDKIFSARAVSWGASSNPRQLAKNQRQVASDRPTARQRHRETPARSPYCPAAARSPACCTTAARPPRPARPGQRSP